MNDCDASSLADRIYSAILNSIIEGEFKEGDRLMTEHALAERFATSRPTVREALARLRADGIIVTRRGSGTTVGRRPDPGVRRFAPLENLVRYPPLLQIPHRHRGRRGGTRRHQSR